MLVYRMRAWAPCPSRWPTLAEFLADNLTSPPVTAALSLVVGCGIGSSLAGSGAGAGGAGAWTTAAISLAVAAVLASVYAGLLAVHWHNWVAPLARRNEEDHVRAGAPAAAPST